MNKTVELRLAYSLHQTTVVIVSETKFIYFDETFISFRSVFNIFLWTFKH